jgi:hypothetical protein
VLVGIVFTVDLFDVRGLYSGALETMTIFFGELEKILQGRLWNFVHGETRIEHVK